MLAGLLPHVPTMPLKQSKSMVSSKVSCWLYAEWQDAIRGANLDMILRDGLENHITIFMNPEHLNRSVALRFSLITVSDTRTSSSDKSGPCMAKFVQQGGHTIVTQLIIKDEPDRIRKTIQDQSNLADVVCLSGGTGISPRDQTYEAIRSILDKTLPGFGEIFRMLSWDQVGSRAMLSRAIAGTYQNMVIFSLPGSPKAVELAMEKLILPEAHHLVAELQRS